MRVDCGPHLAHRILRPESRRLLDAQGLVLAQLLREWNRHFKKRQHGDANALVIWIHPPREYRISNVFCDQIIANGPIRIYGMQLAQFRLGDGHVMRRFLPSTLGGNRSPIRRRDFRQVRFPFLSSALIGPFGKGHTRSSSAESRYTRAPILSECSAPSTLKSWPPNE